MEDNRRKPRRIEENPYLRNQITFYANWYADAQAFRQSGDEASELDFYRGIMEAHFEGTLPNMTDEAYNKVQSYLPHVRASAIRSQNAIKQKAHKGGAPRGNKNAKKEPDEPKDENFEAKKREALDKLKGC